MFSRPAFCLLLCALFSALSAQAAGPKPAEEKFGDWSFVCQTGKDNKKLCLIGQELQTKDDKGASGRLARIGLMRAKDGKGFVIQALLPLGINLRSGAALAVDENKQIALTLTRCTMEGCEAALAPGDAFIQQMRKGGKLKIGFNAGAKTLVVPMSLNGFSKALDKLK